MLLASSGVSGRIHLWIYISVQAVLVMLCIVDLALNTWFHYCLWDFGLVHAHSFDSNIDYDYGESTIGDVQQDMCGGDVNIEPSCPQFCSYVGGFKGAGGAMIFFGTVTLATAIGAIVMHLFALRDRPFKHWLVWVWLSLPASFWLLGTIIYGGVINLGAIPDVDRGKQYDAKNAEPSSGLIFCALIVVFHASLLVYALLTTRKNFQRDSS